MNGEADLIWNKDGSIYHLGITGQELADTIFTVGDPDRVDLVAQHLDKILVQKHNREFKYVLGELKGKRLAIISTGIGTDNIDIVLHELDALAQSLEWTDPLTLIRIGTSGSLREDVPMDSILISESAIGLENLMHWYDYESPEDLKGIIDVFEQRLGIRPQGMHADAGLLAQSPCSWVRGITVTANGFYGPQFRPTRSGTRFSHFIEHISKEDDLRRVTNMEMETAGIYGLSKLLGHRALSVNAILANRVTNTFSKNPDGVVRQMIEEVLEVFISS